MRNCTIRRSRGITRRSWRGAREEAEEGVGGGRVKFLTSPRKRVPNGESSTPGGSRVWLSLPLVQLLFDRPLQLGRLETEWTLIALEGDTAVLADQVQAIRPAPVL